MKPYQASIILRLIAVFLLLSALGDRPYGFYTFLRWFVTIASIYSGYLLYESKNTGIAWVLFIIGILFNPIMPIYMDKGTWGVFDILAGAVLAFSCFSKEV